MARALRAATALLGVAVIGYGLYGLLHDPYIRDPSDVLVWGAAGLLLHDGLWLPLVLLAGAALTRRPFRRAGPALRAGLVVAAALTAVGLPIVLRAGVDHGNASLLPLPYLRNWLLLLGVVAAVVVLVTAAPGVLAAVRGAARLARRRIQARGRRRADRKGRALRE